MKRLLFGLLLGTLITQNTCFASQKAPETEIVDYIKSSYAVPSEIRAARVKELVKQGASIDGQDEYGYTALMWATPLNDTGAIGVLLQHGAEVNLQNEYGRTALIWAAYSLKTEIIDVLIQHDADINHQDEDGYTALIWATYSACNNQDYFPLVPRLVHYGANINLQSKKGDTALMRAKRQKKYFSEIRSKKGVQRCNKVIQYLEKEAPRVSQKKMLTVYGYVRAMNQEEKLSSPIPVCLSSLILAFYFSGK